MAVDEQIKIINHMTTYDCYSRYGALADIAARNESALLEHSDFFNCEQYIQKVERAKDIICTFFNTKNIHVNYRGGGARCQPMTVIKVYGQRFPNLSTAQKKILYYDPLAELGVEIVFSKQSNSYLHRIR